MMSFSVWRALYLAFYSRPLYRDVAGRWHRTAYVYLLLLVAIWWAPGAVLLHQETGEFAAGSAPRLIEQWPTVTIERGRAKAEVTMPFAITDPDNGMRLVVIDTSGATMTLEAAQAPALLTGSALILREGESGSRAYPLTDVEQLTIDRALLSRWLDVLEVWLTPVASVMVVIVFYAYRLVQVLVYAALGLLLVRVVRVTLDYATLMRLAIVALTPAVLLDAVLWSVGLGVPGPISFGLVIGYLYFAIKANAAQDAVVAA
jgi:hypothetical protein